ncbi:MAG: hypothetical protein AMXMBFR33_08850 [Candidatus Xenobia bacterium]
MRVVFLWLLLLLPALAAPLSDRTVIMVVMSDATRLDEVSDLVKQVRDSNGFSESQVPIVFARGDQLTKRDYSILGFSPYSLPVIALVKMSSFGNPEKVVGEPPIIMREVHRYDLAAQVIVARWAQWRGLAVPENLAGALALGSPEQVYALVVDDDASRRASGVSQVERLRAQHGLTFADLPAIGVTSDFLTEQEYARLGFSAEALPAFLVVQNSPAGNPSVVVGRSLVRNCADPMFGAASLFRSFSAARGLPVAANLPATSFSEGSALLITCRPVGPGEVEVEYSYSVQGAFPHTTGYWIQEQRSVRDPRGDNVAPALASFDVRQPLGSELAVARTLTMPTTVPGTYRLRLFVTDKRSGTSLTLESPFEVP